MPAELITRFCEEGLDTLRGVSADILALERERDPTQRYTDILRALHSLKGSARMLGLREIGEVIHATEDVISLLSQSGGQRAADLVTMLLLISDSLQEALVAIHDDGPAKPLDELLSGIETLQLMLLEGLRGRIDDLAAAAPEVFQVLNAQQRELVLRNMAGYRRLLVCELSFRRETFADDVRTVHGVLNDVGLLVSTTGTRELPDPGFDLRFLFLAFSNVDTVELARRLTGYAPHIREIVAGTRGEAASQQSASGLDSAGVRGGPATHDGVVAPYAPTSQDARGGMAPPASGHPAMHAGRAHPDVRRESADSAAAPASPIPVDPDDPSSPPGVGKGATGGADVSAHGRLPDAASHAVSGNAGAPTAARAAEAVPDGGRRPEQPGRMPSLQAQYDMEFARLQAWFLDEGEENLKQLAKEILSLERTPSLETINAIFRSFHNLKGSGGSYKYVNISRLAHLLESFVQPLRVDVRAITPAIVGQMLRGVDLLERVFELSKEGKHDQLPIEEYEAELRAILAMTPVPVEEPPAAVAVPQPVSPQGTEPAKQAARGGAMERPGPRTLTLRSPESMRVNLRKIDAIVNAAVELSIAHHSEHALLASFSDLVERGQRQMHLWLALRDAVIREGVPLPEHLLRDMNEFTAALTDTSDRLGDLSRAVESNLSLWTTLATTLGTDVLQLQLQPLSTLFEVVDRIVRDLSQSLGRTVSAEISGGEVEVDRRIIDALKDPFVHLLRNAIDHGIESPDERRRAGKPERGTIRIEAQQMGFSFSVTISDDGRGLDRARIGTIARQRQLITEEQERTLTDEEVYRLLFRPGFSTRDTVSDISGRGVGLDVVATNVHQFGGEVFVSTTPGAGTRFQIVLPTTLTLSRVLLIEAGQRLFSFPVTGTEQIVMLPPDAIQSFYGRPVTRWNEGLIPVVELEELLGIPRSTRRVRNGLILRTGEATLCLSVPHVVDETELMTKPLPPHLRGNRVISGASVLSDGRVSLFINPRSISGKPVRHADAGTDPPPARRRRVLIVDDSLIARELLRNILLASGYDVDLARDGQEGLQHLRMHMVDAVLTDVDMPVMDGYSFTRAVKADPQLQDLPVIMVTSKEDAEQRRRGLEAGADAYLLKGSFHQTNLLDVLRDLIAREAA